MNLHQRPAPTIAVLGTALVLALSACGGDDDAQPTADPPADEQPVDETPPVESPAPATAPASITFEAQESNGAMITVASVDLPAPGFIAVHGDGDGAPGPVIGHSELLPAGLSNDVMVMLGEPIDADATLYPMVHIDTNENGIYEFGAVEGVDGPGLTADGDVAVVGATVSIARDDDDAGSAEAGDNEITIAGFAFSGATEVPVGTTVTVTNTDSTPHTWSAGDDTFDSGSIAPGESFEFTFTQPGEFDYSCNFHPSMKGTIVVTP